MNCDFYGALLAVGLFFVCIALAGAVLLLSIPTGMQMWQEWAEKRKARKP